MSKNHKSPYVISLNENNNNRKKITSKNIRESKIISPTSGSEPPFDPQKWNEDEEIQYNHNCYAYLLNTVAPTRSGKPQPGYFSGFPPLSNNDYNCIEFYNRMKKDIPSLYLTSFDEKCKSGFYKGFLALDPKIEDQDYHFYRQDKSGKWSHKPGRLEAINYDASNKPILNPRKANRKYQHFNYSKPCFFFCLNNKLSRSRSRSRRSI